MTLTIVVGPPCAGKSTYAWAERNEDELVVDFDRIALALGASVSHGAEGDIKSAAFAARGAAKRVALATDESSWIIHTSPSAAQLTSYDDAGAAFLLLDPGEEECITRAQDAGRPDGTEDAIRAWYADPPIMPESTTRVTATIGRNPMARDLPAQKHENRYWGNKTVPKAKAEFFNAITMPAQAGEGTVATIRMYGPIDSWGGWWGISAKDMGVVLDALPDSVTQIILRINSPGGEVFEALSILNMLRAHKASVTAVVDALAASAASFIAAGCDETVMSPGTQMMIHSPLVITYGNAVELRKAADMLDGLESSIVEIYTAKAGEKDWTTLLADDTWLTAAQTVDLGLADRVAVIPDAGETETVGAEELVLTAPDDDDDYLARVTSLPNRAAARSHNLPSSSEPGQPTRKDPLMKSDTLKAGLRERLGVTDSAISEEQLTTVVNEVIAEQASSNPAAPAGTVLIDSAVLTDLQASAALGRQAREEQDKSRRAAVVDAAMHEGRIAPASRDMWLAQLTANEEGTTTLIGSLPKNTIPVTEIGHSDDATTDDDRAYASIFGDTKEA